ncbi:WAT1-related protein [Arachis hypogaea]|nr:WAT1-related protein [Arachis hypogaea]
MKNRDKTALYRYLRRTIRNKCLAEGLWELTVPVSPFFFWGTAMVAMKEVIPRTGPFFVSAFRLIPAGFLLIGFAASRGRPFPSGLNAWLSISLFALVDAACFQGFLAEGLQRTSAGLGSVIIDSQPLTVAVLAALLFGESIGIVGAAGLVLGVVGLVLLEGAIVTSPKAQSMAVGTVMVRWVSKYSDPVMATGWHMVIGGLPLVAFSILNNDPALGQSLQEYSSTDIFQLIYSFPVQMIYPSSSSIPSSPALSLFHLSSLRSCPCPPLAQDLLCSVLGLLASRAQELVENGLMLFQFPVSNVLLDSDVDLAKVFELIGTCLVDMAKVGVISEEKVDSFNVPLIYPSAKAVKEILRGCDECFSIEWMEILEFKNMVSLPTVQIFVSWFRAALQGMIEKHFGVEIVDELFKRFAEKIKEFPDIMDTDKLKLDVLFVLLRRKNKARP